MRLDFLHPHPRAQEGPKLSDYRLAATPKPQELEDALAAALGIRGQVRAGSGGGAEGFCPDASKHQDKSVFDILG